MDSLDIELKEAPLALPEVISLVHPKTHIDDIFSMIPSTGLVGVEQEPYADTFLCEHSKNAILRSCGAGIAAADDLINSSKKRMFCAIRPPGHHAETTRVNGFCFINNTAVSARYLQKKHQLGKIAIIDFDVHHGNGTQEIFYSDNSVAYGSIHEHPLFPGTGSENENGVGNIFNAPIQSGTGSDEFLMIFEERILANIDEFKPDAILISTGFDAHRRDPLANVNLESEDYYTLTQSIVEIANLHCDGGIISFLEGGYDLLALSEGTKAHLKALNEK